jgi:hypothetical protein
MDDRDFSFYLSQNDRENSWINQLIVIFCLFWSIITGIERWIASSNRIWFRCQKFPIAIPSVTAESIETDSIDPGDGPWTSEIIEKIWN